MKCSACFNYGQRSRIRVEGFHSSEAGSFCPNALLNSDSLHSVLEWRYNHISGMLFQSICAFAERLLMKYFHDVGMVEKILFHFFVSRSEHEMELKQITVCII